MILIFSLTIQTLSHTTPISDWHKQKILQYNERFKDKSSRQLKISKGIIRQKSMFQIMKKRIGRKISLKTTSTFRSFDASSTNSSYGYTLWRKKKSRKKILVNLSQKSSRCNIFFLYFLFVFVLCVCMCAFAFLFLFFTFTNAIMRKQPAFMEICSAFQQQIGTGKWKAFFEQHGC